MHAAFALQTFHGHTRTDDLGQTVNVHCLDTQFLLNLIPHVLAPGLGPMDTHPKLQIFGRYPHVGHGIGQIESIRRCGHQDG